MKRSPRQAAFTLIEMITVIAIIIILVSLVIAVNGLVQRQSAKARTNAEIMMLSQACENYKTDNGGYPQDVSAGASITSSLDPKASLSPTSYIKSCSFLYVQLSGDSNANGVIDPQEKTNTNYAPDFFKTSRLAGGASTGQPAYMMDPYGNSYGYSTAGLLLQQEWQSNLATNSSAQKPSANSLGTQGYNSSFDLWSTGGTTGSGTYDTAKWVKNW